MNDDVRPVVKGATQKGRRHRVVYDQGYAGSVGDSRDFLDIRGIQAGIADGLDENAFCPVVDGGGKGIGAGCFHEGGFNVILRQGMQEEVVSPAVKTGRGDNVIAGPADVDDGIGYGG